MNKHGRKCTLIVPVRNEAKNLVSPVNEIPEFIDQVIMVVDASSTDDSLNVANAIERVALVIVQKIFSDQSESRLTVFDGFDKLGERNRINVILRLKASSISKTLGYMNRVTSRMNLVVGDRFQALYSAQQQLFDLAENVKPSEPNSEMCC